DPVLGGVVAGDVLEPGQIEGGAQLAVEDGEHVAVELGGDAGGVVVGGLEPGDVLHQVGAEEERVAWVHRVRQRVQHGGSLLGYEVAYGAAEEGDHAGSAAGKQLKVVFEVADDGLDVDSRIVTQDGGGRLPQRRLADVERHEPLQRAGVGQVLQQYARLLRRA